MGPSQLAARYTSTCTLPWCDEPARGTGGCLCDGHERYRTRCQERGEEPRYEPIAKTEPPKERLVTLYGELAETAAEDDAAYARNEERFLRGVETFMRARGWRPPNMKCPITREKCLAATARREREPAKPHWATRARAPSRAEMAPPRKV